jgi:hypothetical protein
MSAAPHEIGAPVPALAVVTDPPPAPAPSPSLAQLMSRRLPAAAHALKEPTFDELVTGCGRHRGPQESVTPASLARRLALRARLLRTPARRPAAHPTRTP